MKKLLVTLFASAAMLAGTANATLIEATVGDIDILGSTYAVTLIQDDASTNANSFDAIMPSITFTTLSDALAAMDAVSAFVGDPNTYDWTPGGFGSSTRLVYGADATTYTYITNFTVTNPYSGPFTLARNGANVFSFLQFRSIDAAAVPAPATLLLLGLGLLGLGATRRKA